MAYKFSFGYSGAGLFITMQSSSGNTPLNALGLAASTIYENTSNGTYVGTISGRTLGSTIVLTSSAGGRFALNTSTGVVTVANGSLLDYETATSHQIQISEILDGRSNSPRLSTLTINITDVPLASWSVAPSITGLTTIGAVLTGVDGTTNGTIILREWLRDGGVIATGNSYTTVDADAGKVISYRVTAQNTAGENASTSATHGPIEAGLNMYFSTIGNSQFIALIDGDF